MIRTTKILSQPQNWMAFATFKMTWICLNIICSHSRVLHQNQSITAHLLESGEYKNKGRIFLCDSTMIHTTEKDIYERVS